jgi:hypothetical protein
MRRGSARMRPAKVSARTPARAFVARSSARTPCQRFDAKPELRGPAAAVLTGPGMPFRRVTEVGLGRAGIVMGLEAWKATSSSLPHST